MMGKNLESQVVSKQVIDDYTTGDFFLASPRRTLLGKGVFSKVAHADGKSISDQVNLALHEAKQKGHTNPFVVGAIPFDDSNTMSLIIPEKMIVSLPLLRDDIKTKNETMTYVTNLQSIPEAPHYVHNVKKGIELIKSGQLDKIVLSRSLHLTTSEEIEIPSLIRRLVKQNDAGYTFAVDLSDYSKEAIEPKKTLLGASPELLVSKIGEQLFANPLAGSRPRSSDPLEDQRRANELLHSSKDLHEHAVVVKQVADTLRPFCQVLEVPQTPSVIHTETMWHLSTEIKGTLLDSRTTSLDLAIALHPTPAVCGSPTEQARQAIAEIEPFDRSYFTGMLGWCNADGDGEWIVTIRCAEVEKQELRLFAGAGIVAESVPEHEFEETAAKFRTMLLALELNNKE